MPIDELINYWPKTKLPVYTKIADPKYNDFQIGHEYEMRIEDPKRVEEKGDSGPYNYVHECILIAKEEMKLGKLPGLLLAFDTHTQEKEKALKRLSPGEELWNDDTDIVLLIFLRKDIAKEFVLSDMETLEGEDVTSEFSKEDAEAT